jgi:hypothetical protein
MPVHDWTRVEAGILHHFHHGWIAQVARALNRGLLPPDHYALAEQIAGGLGPDVFTLQGPTNGLDRALVRLRKQRRKFRRVPWKRRSRAPGPVSLRSNRSGLVEGVEQVVGFLL